MHEHESGRFPTWAEGEQASDLAWIEENRAILWLAATVAFEEIGYGFIVVDLTGQTENLGHPFGYHSEGELEPQDEELRRLLKEYDPDRQFIVVLWKAEGRSSVYLSARPPMGWYGEMRTQTQYPKPQGEPEDTAAAIEREPRMGSHRGGDDYPRGL